MLHYELPKLFQLKDLPEFKRFQKANPRKNLTALHTAVTYGQAIHWLSILDILWPDFEANPYYSIEVAYITCNDVDDPTYPKEFYEQIRQTIAMFWRIQLEDLHPEGGWDVEIWDDAEMTLCTSFEKARSQ